MNAVRLLPVMISMLLLAAHFLRSGWLAVSVACVLLPFLLLLRKRWIPSLFKAALVLGTLEWLRTLYVFAAMRIAFDEPWTRLAVILGAVAAFTLLSALVFRTLALRRFYNIPE